MLRSTYHVFDLYVNYLGDEVLEAWAEDMETMQANAQDGRAETVEVLDVLGTRFTSDGTLAFAAVNKDPFEEKALVLHPGIDGAYCWRQITVWGESTESYNDIGHTEVELKEGEWREGNGSRRVFLCLTESKLLKDDFFFVMLFEHACSGHKFHLIEIQFLNSIAGMYVIDDSLQAGVVLELLIIEAVCKIFFHIY